MLVAGLTGGIASGKSTVCDMFRSLGAHIVDLDRLSRIVVEPGRPAWKDIVDYFGEGILNPDRTLNRSVLGEEVFKDPEKRKLLEGFIHPRVLEEQGAILTSIKENDPRAIVILDVPLLIEVGLHTEVDVVILVHIPRHLQIERLMRRDGFTLDEARMRLDAQMPIDEKIPYAHYVIDNSGDLIKTRRQVEEVFASLRRREGSQGVTG